MYLLIKVATLVVTYNNLFYCKMQGAPKEKFFFQLSSCTTGVVEMIRITSQGSISVFAHLNYYHKCSFSSVLAMFLLLLPPSKKFNQDFMILIMNTFCSSLQRVKIIKFTVSADSFHLHSTTTHLKK